MRAARIIVGVVAVVALARSGCDGGAPACPRGAAPLESGVLVDINAFRRAHHLPPLRLNARLGAAARAHTVEMAQDGYFAHESPDGSLFWKRIQSFYASSPWRYWSVGENLLWSSPGVTPAKALQMWIASPEHKREPDERALARDRRRRRARRVRAGRLQGPRRHDRDDRLRRPEVARTLLV